MYDNNGNYIYNNVPKKINTNNSFSGIMSLVLIGLIIFIGLISFNVIDNPFTFMNNKDSGLEISPKEINISKGGSYQIETIKAPGAIEYKSSDSNIVEVNEYTGYIIGKKAGTATITAYLKTDNSIKDECVVTVESVESNIEVSNIKLNKNSMNINVGDSSILTYTVSPNNANIKKVYWSSSNKNIVTVDKNGKVVGVKEGTATITIRTENGTTNSCTVTVSKKQSSTPSKTSSPTVTFTLTYNANGGMVSPKSKELNQGSEYGSFPTPTRNGYTFTGWYTSSDGKTKVNSSTKIYGNTTIYAGWKQNSSGESTTITTYTLTYNANGGSVSPTSKKLEKGSVYGSLPTPTRSGYTFLGWYTSSSGGTKVSSDVKIYDNTTIYAHWSKNSSSSTPSTPSTPSANTKVNLENINNAVGICYSTWFNPVIDSSVNPPLVVGTNQINAGYIYYWGKPAKGFYRSDNKDVIKYHMNLLRDANIDFIILDNTNANTGWKNEYSWFGKPSSSTSYWEEMVSKSTKALLDTMLEMNNQGIKTPKVVNWVNTNGGTGTLDAIYSEFYTNSKYTNLWLYYGGKPLVLTTSQTSYSHFTTRKMWGLESNHGNNWSFLERSNKATTNNEQISVSVAVQSSYMSDEKEMCRKRGATFYNQWKNAFNSKSKVVTITWWNEWTAIALNVGGQVKFTDNYNQECSRDIEPMSGGHGDKYYKLMKLLISDYKNNKSIRSLSEYQKEAGL